MDSEVIDHYVDRRGFKSDSDFIIAELNKISAEFVKAKKATENVIGAKTWREFRESTEEAKKAQESFTKTTQNFLKTEKEASAEKLRAAKAAKAEADAIIRAAKAKEAEEKAKQAGLKTQAAEITLREKNTKAAEREAAEAAKKASLSSRPVDSIPFEINTGENITEYKNKLTELQQQQLELEHSAIAWAEAEKKAAQQVGGVTNETTKSVVGISQYKDNLEELTGTLDDNLIVQDLLKDELNQTGIDLSNLKKNTSDAAKGSDEYQAKIASLSGRQFELKKSIAEVSLTIKNQIREQNEAAGSADKLRARLLLANQAYDKMSEKVKNGGQGKFLLTEINALTAAVNKHEQGSGRFQRVVGQYQNAFLKAGKAFSSFLTPFRMAANILPGLGMSGLFLGIGRGVMFLIERLNGGAKSISEFVQKQKMLTEAFKDNSYKSAIENVKTLRAEIDLAREGTISKERVVKHYNDTIGKTTGIVKDLDEAEKALTKNADAYIKMTLYKAAANLAFDEAGKKALERQRKMLTERPSDKEYMEGLKSVTENPEFIKLTEEYEAALFGGDEKKKAEKIKERNALESKLREEQREKELLKEEQQATEIGNIFLKKVAEISKNFGFNFFGDNDANKNKEKAFKAGNDIREATFNAQKLILQDSIAIQKEVFDNEKLSFEERYKSALTYNLLQKKLLKTEYEYNLENIRLKEISDKEAAKEQFKNATERQKAITYAIDAATAKRAELEGKYNSDVAKSNAAFQKDYISKLTKFFADIADKREKHRLAMQDIRTEELKNEWDAAFNDADKNFLQELKKAGNNQKKREDAERKHNFRKLQLQAQFQIASLQQQIEFAEEQLKIDRLRAESSGEQEALDRVTKAETKIAGMRIGLVKLVSDFQIAKNKETAESSKKSLDEIADKFQEISNVALQFGDAISGIFIAQSEKEKNAIQEQIDLLEKKRLKDIEVAEQTITNADERAAAIAVIEARAATQREQLERKQRQADERRARWDKALNIAKIIQSTSVAIMGYLAVQNYGMAIAAGVIGGVQLASAIATPIPKYKTGKGANDNYEGWAWVGDGGKHELHQKADGTSVVTPNTPTLTWVGKDDIIHPDVNAMMKRSVFQTHKHLQGVEALKQKDDTVNFEMLNKSIKSGFMMLNNTIKNKSEAPQAYPDNLMRRVERYKQSNKEYFKRKGYDV